MSYGHLKSGNLELIVQLTLTLGMTGWEKVPLAYSAVCCVDGQVGLLCVPGAVGGP